MALPSTKGASICTNCNLTGTSICVNRDSSTEAVKTLSHGFKNL